MKRKLISLLAAVCLLASIGSATASAAQWQPTSYYDILARLNMLSGGQFSFGPVEETPEAPQENETPETPEVSETPEEPEAPTESETPGQSGSVSSYAQAVLDLVNRYRAQNGLAALTLDSGLCQVAQTKAQDMHDSGYFAHESPNYGTPFEMMSFFGISYKAAGENIAMGYSSPQAVVEGWMNSEGHRANILSSSFTKMGLGYVASGNYWCQMFIG